MKTRLLIVGLMVGILFLASCTVQQQPLAAEQPLQPPALDAETDTAPAATTTQVYQVVLEDSNLMPVDVEINAGDVVEWVNKDTVRYTLKFSGSEERLPVGGTFEQRFTEAGMVRYSATVVEEDQEDDRQQELQGTIVVN